MRVYDVTSVNRHRVSVEGVAHLVLMWRCSKHHIITFDINVHESLLVQLTEHCHLRSVSRQKLLALAFQNRVSPLTHHLQTHQSHISKRHPTGMLLQNVCDSIRTFFKHQVSVLILHGWAKAHFSVRRF